MADGPLPSIAGIAALPAETWRDFGRCLRNAGFDGAFLQRCWGVPSRSYESLQWPIRVARARRLDLPAAHACRLLMLRDPVTLAEAAAVFRPALVDRLIAAGLFVPSGADRIASAFDCKLFMDLVILCDDLAHEGDAVFGAGPGTLAFGGLLDNGRAIGDALDVGCGAGAVALSMARHARRVVGIDINPRALAFLAINAAINDADNVEARHGDLFEPVAGEQFDLIATQPPFVPRPPGARDTTYLFGGPSGNEPVRRIVAAVPGHLRRGGRAVIVFEQAVTAAADHDGSGEPVLGVPGELQTLVILGAEVGAEAYSIRHASAQVRRGVDEFDRRAAAMYLHLQELGIRGLSPGICVMEHRAESPAWTATLHAGTTLWNELSPITIDRLMAGNRAARGSTAHLLRARVRIPENSLVIRRPSPDGSTAGCVHLGLPPGYLFSSLEFTAHEWQRLESLSRGEPVDAAVEVVGKALRAGLIDL
jgi:SAM-dependent methyltransferase